MVTAMVSPTALKTSMEYPSVPSGAAWWSTSLTISPRGENGDRLLCLG